MDWLCESMTKHGLIFKEGMLWVCKYLATPKGSFVRAWNDSILFAMSNNIGEEYMLYYVDVLRAVNLSFVEFGINIFVVSPCMFRMLIKEFELNNVSAICKGQIYISKSKKKVFNNIPGIISRTEIIKFIARMLDMPVCQVEYAKNYAPEQINLLDFYVYLGYV